MDNLAIFTFLRDQARSGQRTVLVTLAESDGPSMRRPGSHMAVSENGAWVGSLSSGCIETAIVAEAQHVIAAQGPRVVRYGRGSPYIDIRLPCGGGVDLHFLPLPDAALAEHALAEISARRPFELALPAAEGAGHIVHHQPNPLLVILGDGVVVATMAGLAQAAGVEVAIASHDEGAIAAAQSASVPAHHLQRLDQDLAIASDKWTAFLFLFHDHDWERHLLPQALQRQRFYCGAMGSRRVHEARVAMLREAGTGEDDIASISAPVGLIASTRDPHTLAVSALAEILRDYHAFCADRATVTRAET